MPSLIPARGIRMPDELYLKLKRMAANEQRSLNRQVVFILEDYVRYYESEYGIIEVNTDELYK